MKRLPLVRAFSTTRRTSTHCTSLRRASTRSIFHEYSCLGRSKESQPPPIPPHHPHHITATRLFSSTQQPSKSTASSNHDANATPNNNDETSATTISSDANHHHDPDSDTIFALSSGMGVGGQATAVAVLRISGPDALWALQQMTPRTCQPRQATLATLRYEGRVLDQALVLYFPAPNSFTGQDIVELHTHGSRAVLQDILTVLEGLQQPGGTRLRYADAGEFTSRAFAAGKLDVLQVEALADLLAADTVLQKQQALSQLQGDLSRLYTHWKQELIGALAHAEAIIDFGDDEHLGMDDDGLQSDEEMQETQDNLWGGVTDQVATLRNSMQQQLQHAQRGEWVREGFRVAIVGPPNAGKSSLFNILAQDEEAAIVSPIQGTTRDVLSVNLNLGGIKCRLSDTAGLREETSDVIEQVGIQRAQQAAAQADLVLVLLDVAALTSSQTTLADELDRLVPSKEIERENVVLVLNKADLLSESETDFASNDMQQSLAAVYTISCQTQVGMNEFLKGLTDQIMERVMGSSASSATTKYNKAEDPLMTRGRHRQHVQAACDALERFEMLQREGLVTVDIAAEELRLAASELGRLTGAIDVEEVLDQLFTDFCIGK